MSAQTGLITIGFNDAYDFREACEESYVTISQEEVGRSKEGAVVTLDFRIEFHTVAQVFICGQLFLKKIVEKERLILENP